MISRIIPAPERHRLREAELREIRLRFQRELELEHATELASASWWGRFRLRHAIRQEALRKYPALSPRSFRSLSEV